MDKETFGVCNTCFVRLWHLRSLYHVFKGVTIHRLSSNIVERLPYT